MTSQASRRFNDLDNFERDFRVKNAFKNNDFFIFSKKIMKVIYKIQDEEISSEKNVWEFFFLYRKHLNKSFLHVVSSFLFGFYTFFDFFGCFFFSLFLQKFFPSFFRAGFSFLLLFIAPVRRPAQRQRLRRRRASTDAPEARPRPPRPCP